MSSEEKLFPCLFSRYFSPRCFAPNFNLAFNRAYNFSLRHPFDTIFFVNATIFFLLTRSICQRQMCNSVTKISNLPSPEFSLCIYTHIYLPTDTPMEIMVTRFKNACLVLLLRRLVYSNFLRKNFDSYNNIGLSMPILL